MRENVSNLKIPPIGLNGKKLLENRNILKILNGCNNVLNLMVVNLLVFKQFEYVKWCGRS